MRKVSTAIRFIVVVLFAAVLHAAFLTSAVHAASKSSKAKFEDLTVKLATEIRAGDLDKALPLAKEVLALSIKNNGQRNAVTARWTTTLADIYRGKNQFTQARTQYKRAIAILEKTEGKNNASLALPLNGLAKLYQEKKRFPEAEKLFERSLAILKKTPGADRSIVAANLGSQAVLKYRQKKWDEAANLWQVSTDLLIQLKLHEVAGTNRDEPVKTPSERGNENARFWRLVKVSYRAAASPVQMSETAAKMFEIAQWAQNAKAVQSLAPMAARLVKSESPLDKLLSKRRDLAVEWHSVKSYPLSENPSSPEANNEADKLASENEKAALKRLAAIDDQIKEIDDEIAEEHSKYAAITSLKPLSVEELQGLLKSDEALVFFLDTPEQAPLPGETFVWVVTQNKIRWVSADIGSAELQREVGALRCGLDAQAWEKDTNCAKELGVEYSSNDYRKGHPLPFDASRAHALYKALFSKVEDQIQDKKLLIVASGALTKLPFQVLVTQKPQTAFPNAEGMRNTHWLIRKHALTILPAVSSLKAPRTYGKASTATKSYLGIGNPLLEGKSRRYASLANKAQEKQTCGGKKTEQLPTGGKKNSLSRSLIPVEYTGNLADADRVRKQPPLPETADELCAIARDLKVGDEDVLLGNKATEANIKALSDQGVLAQYRALHFATHGFLAGQIATDAEPGLILTPPAKARPYDDGYLSASEIMGLKLDADWVILSACNTAMAKPHSAEALSGLARAFFYAGGRSVLETYWLAKTRATVKLVTTAFKTIAKDASVTQAEAVRLAMIELIDKGALEDAHPEYWAPFVLVGEGGGA